jgi:hypothetical protein
VNFEVVGMCVEAVVVLGAESVDFLFSWCDLKNLSEDHIQHVPWCIGYHMMRHWPQTVAWDDRFWRKTPFFINLERMKGLRTPWKASTVLVPWRILLLMGLALKPHILEVSRSRLGPLVRYLD